MSETVLLNSLLSVRRRVRLLSLVHGLGVLLSAVVGLLLATVLVDFILNLPAVPRLVLIAAAAFGVGTVFWKQVARPLMARLPLGDVAGKIEQTFPVFEDRFRSVVNFSAHPNNESEAMKRRVVAQTTALAGHVDVRQVVRQQPAWRALGMGLAAAVLLMVMAWAVGPDYLSAALSRLLTPFAGQAWPKWTQIALVGQTPQRVVAGTPVDVRIRLVKGDKPSAKAMVYYQYDQEGPVQQELMTRNADGTYTASLDARLEAGKASGSMNIWMQSGDDRKQLPPVRVLPPLAIRQVEAVVLPPRYADQIPVTLDLASAPASITVGSDVEMRVNFSKPLAAGVSPHLEAIAPDTTVPAVQWQAVAEGAESAVARWTAGQTAHFKILATDEDGFTNSGIEEYQILVKPDQLPSVQIEKPIRNQEVTPDAMVPIQAVASDDFGIKTLQLMAKRLGDQKSWTIDLIGDARPATDAVQWRKLDGSGDLLRFRMNWDWELAKLDGAALKPGDQLDFYLRVQDNYEDDHGRPHDPPFSESGHLRLTVISQETLNEQLNDQLSQLRSQVEETRRQNEAVKSGVRSLQQDTQNKPAMDHADRAMANQLANDQSTAASQAKQIADRLGEMQDRLQQNHSQNAELANNISQARQILNDAAENPMKEAAARLSDMGDQQQQQQRQQSSADRSAAMDQVQQRQATASSQLQAAMDRMGSDSGLSQFLKKVADLLQQQQQLSRQTAQAGQNTLGKDPTQLTEQERKTTQDLAAQQQDLARQTDQAMSKMTDAAQRQARTDPSTSQALQQAAQTGQQQNVSGQMNQAAQAEQQNQQADAQTGQKQAELGLMMVLNQLKEAENRRLMELMRQLETAQELVGDLLEQQAGHNLDNLLLQGTTAMSDAVKNGPDLVTELIEYSQRDPQHLAAPPPVETQIALQAQTERNTRTIVALVQALPEGAGPADSLTHAAQRMARAVSYLEDHKLTDAYQPPQVEAFASLLDAKTELDRQAQQAQQRMQDQQKESLRQQFVEIRDEQVKINDKTKTINAGPRGSDGQFGHAARANLGITADAQAALAKRTAKLNDDLTAIGSVAYAYANNDITDKMGAISQSLGKLDAGTATQRTQQRVVRELDDMIKNLAMRPRQSQYNTPRNSSGGGAGQQQQGAPRLPPEAEIRLIQDMQRMLNDDTKDAAATTPPDKAGVLNLGKRQGDLRKMLDDLLQKSSEGKVTLGPEPENKATLPEEATDEDLDLQELKDSALNATPDEQGIKDDTSMLGVRMARARQRLALDADPGTTTQKIQERIVIEMDALAQMAQQQEATQSRSRSGQRPQRQNAPGQQQQGNNPGNALAQGQRDQGPQANNPAQRGGATPGGNTAGLTQQDINAQVAEMKESWGKLSPRQRAAVMEGSTDQTLQKFKDFVDGYYRTLAEKTAQPQQ
jgi:hypothetical protein